MLTCRLQAVSNKKLALVAALRKHYQPALQRDPELGQLLDVVEETFFQVSLPPKR